MSFKVGDTVRIVTDSILVRSGAVGTVVAVTEFEFPFQVQLDDRDAPLNFAEEDLELVEDVAVVQCHDFAKWMVKEFDRMKALFEEKNKQYGTLDPLANFRTSANMNAGTDTMAAMFREAWSFASKHIAHVANNGIRGSKVDESLGDIAVYALIMKYMYEKEHKK